MKQKSQDKVPKAVWAPFNSAKSLYNDAAALPGGFRYNATRYLLYIKSWELYFIANASFSAWASNEAADPKTLKDHGYKLDNSPEVQYITIVDHKAVETPYKSGDQKKKLLNLLVFGDKDKSREEIFMRGWFFDDFARQLKKLDLLGVALKAIDEWDD